MSDDAVYESDKVAGLSDSGDYPSDTDLYASWKASGQDRVYVRTILPDGTIHVTCFKRKKNRRPGHSAYHSDRSKSQTRYGSDRSERRFEDLWSEYSSDALPENHYESEGVPQRKKPRRIAPVYYIDPEKGNDKYLGTKGWPFRTKEAALAASRRDREKGLYGLDRRRKKPFKGRSPRKWQSGAHAL